MDRGVPLQLPETTHLQFLVLGVLLEGPHIGRDVRSRLDEFGVGKSGPGFYQMMGRLEDSNYVTGCYEQQVIDGQRVKQRRYEITSAGRTAWRASRDFYVESIRVLKDAPGLANA